MEEKEIPALGRPFDVGMLYDCRTNNLITDKRVWNEQSIKQHTTSQSQPQCDFDFTAEDTISAKTSFLDINADLKLSLLFGWIEVHGSAKYLENHRTFTRQSRVSFKYRCRTHFKELRINELMSDQHEDRQVLDSGNATHVVTGILYGIDAIFMFDRNTNDNEDKLQIQNKLEAMIKFLPKASVTSNRDEHTNKFLDNVKCTYHGDIPIDFEHETYEEAIKVYKTLPSKVGRNGKYSIPMTVWLYPISKLTNKTLSLNFFINDTLVNQIQDMFETIQHLKMKCNDLLASPSCEYDETCCQKVCEMKTAVERSEQKLKSQLSKSVNTVTSIDSVKRNVGKLLKEFEQSAIGPEKLESSISEIRTVISVIDTCVKKIIPENKDIHFELPSIDKFYGNLMGDNSRVSTNEQRKQKLRSNFQSMRKTLKEDINMLNVRFNENVKPSVRRTYDHFIEISWQVPQNEPDRYEVSYRRVDTEEWKIFPFEIIHPRLRLWSSTFEVNTDYILRVRYVGKFGEYSEVSDVFNTEYCSICNHVNRTFNKVGLIPCIKR